MNRRTDEQTNRRTDEQRNNEGICSHIRSTHTSLFNIYLFNIRYSLCFCILIMGLACTSVKAQEVEANLSFQTDTMAVGKPVPLRMVIEHPESMVVVFPRHKRDFEPFELVSAKPEPTQTTNGRSRDAVVYMVRSFEIGKNQSISLPYAYYRGGDTTWKFVQSNPIGLNERVKPPLDNRSFRASEDIYHLTEPPDYGKIIITIVGFIGILGLIGFALRKPIERYFMLRKNRVEWISIRRQLRRLPQLRDQAEIFETLNLIWKSYLDPSDTFNLRSLTTTELKRNLTELPAIDKDQRQTLIHIAETGDQVIYAGAEIETVQLGQLISRLTKILGKVYEERKRELIERV